MTKLTDTQLIVLSAAAKHDGGLTIRPINLHAAAASKVATSLINKGLVREIRAKMDAPVWREGEDGRYSLKITRAGRDAIGVDHGDAEDEAPPLQKVAEARSKKRAGKLTDTKAAPRGLAVRTRAAAPQNAVNRDDSSAPGLRSGSK